MPDLNSDKIAMDMPNKRDWFKTIGIIVIAFLVWLNAAKTQQRAREDRERLDVRGC
jgi:hypothetical protein